MLCVEFITEHVLSKLCMIPQHYKMKLDCPKNGFSCDSDYTVASCLNKCFSSSKTAMFNGGAS